MRCSLWTSTLTRTRTTSLWRCSVECREFAQQARNGAARDPKVVVAITLRDDQTIGLLSKAHADCFAKLTQGGAALDDCTLETRSFLARTGPFHCSRRSAGQQRAAHRSRDEESQAEIIAAVKAQYAATGGTERFLATMLIDIACRVGSSRSS